MFTVIPWLISRCRQQHIYTASNGGIVSGWEMLEGQEGSVRRRIWRTILAFAWRDFGKPRKTRHESRSWAEIWSRNPQNTRQQRHSVTVALRTQQTRIFRPVRRMTVALATRCVAYFTRHRQEMSTDFFLRRWLYCQTNVAFSIYKFNMADLVIWRALLPTSVLVGGGRLNGVSVFKNFKRSFY